MPNLFEMRKQHAFALKKAESIVAATELAGRQMTEDEDTRNTTWLCPPWPHSAHKSQSVKKQSTLHQHLVDGKIIPAGGNLRLARTPGAPVVLSEIYYNDFHPGSAAVVSRWARPCTKAAGAAGGFAVPVIVEGQVVPVGTIGNGRSGHRIRNSHGDGH